MLKGKNFSITISIICILFGFALILGPSLLDHLPRYIVLDPPVPENVFIISEEKSIYIPYTGGDVAVENDKLWIWRKEYDYLPLGDKPDTTETILAYFDKWLNEQGWKKYEEQGFPCGGMRESDFLDRGKNLFAYIPKDAKNAYYSSAVCVAAWPYSTATDATGFMVLLYSETP